MLNFYQNEINLNEINSNQPKLELIVNIPNTNNRFYTNYKEYDIYYLNKKQKICLILDLSLTILNTELAFNGNLDKFEHAMILSNISAISKKPLVSFITFSIGKELINDKILNNGTPDIKDVGANGLGVLKYYLEKK